MTGYEHYSNVLIPRTSLAVQQRRLPKNTLISEALAMMDQLGRERDQPKVVSENTTVVRRRLTGCSRVCVYFCTQSLGPNPNPGMYLEQATMDKCQCTTIFEKAYAVHLRKWAEICGMRFAMTAGGEFTYPVHNWQSLGKAWAQCAGSDRWVHGLLVAFSQPPHRLPAFRMD